MIMKNHFLSFLIIIIARQHTLACSVQYLLFYNFCLSIRLSVFNEWTICPFTHNTITIWPPDRGHHYNFHSLASITQFPGRRGKMFFFCLKSPFTLETVWDTPKYIMDQKVIDTAPMEIRVGSDHLEWSWNTGQEGTNFSGQSPYVPYRLTYDYQTRHSGVSLGRQLSPPIPKGWNPENTLRASTYTHTVWPKATKFGMVTCGAQAFFYGSGKLPS